MAPRRIGYQSEFNRSRLFPFCGRGNRLIEAMCPRCPTHRVVRELGFGAMLSGLEPFIPSVVVCHRSSWWPEF